MEVALTEEAKRSGTQAEVLAIDRLMQMYLPPNSIPMEVLKPGATLADLLGDYIGCIETGDENIDEKFAEGLRTKKQNGNFTACAEWPIVAPPEL